MVKILLSMLFVFLGGCGTDTLTIANGQSQAESANANAKSDVAKAKTAEDDADTKKRAQTEKIHVVAGDDQQVVEGSPVLLYASEVDTKSTIVRYVWKEEDKVLATQKEVVLDSLSPGVHKIILEAVDEDGEVFTDIVTVEVKPPMEKNHLPKANDLFFTTPEDVTFDGALRGSDEDGDFLKYLLVSLPENGTLSGSPARLHYTPDPDFFGEDKFYFKTNDGKIDSALATVTIQVEPRNDPPQIKALHESIVEDERLHITLRAEDKEDDALTFLLTTLPKYGNAVIRENELIYTPQKGFSGREVFTYKANDGTCDSKEENITIDVTHINHIPTAVPLHAQTDEDTPTVITLQGEDSDLHDQLTYRVVTQAKLGSVRIADNKLYYTPDANKNGIETLQYVVSDGIGESDPAEISITVRSVNDIPQVHSFLIETSEDTAKTVNLSADDPDGDTVTFHIAQQSQHGRVTLNDARLIYTPDTNFYGSDSFSYFADDGLAQSQPKIVNVTVTAVNDSPVATDLRYSVMEGESVDVILEGSDIDSTSLTYFHENPQHGRLSGSGKELSYTPEEGFTGNDSFIYWVSDGSAQSQRKTVFITVTEQPNSAPVVSDRSVTLNEDTTQTVMLSASDADNDPLTFQIVTRPSHGVATLVGEQLEYRPDADFFGEDTLTYTANDGKAGSAAATVHFYVEAVNDAPTAQSQTISVNEDTPYTFTLRAEDVENDTLIYVIDTLPQHGNIVCNGASCTYTPLADFSGSDNFAFHVNDGELDSGMQSVDIVVNAANDVPVALAKSYTLFEDGNLTLTLEANDADNDTLQYLIVSQPSHGSVQLTGNTVLYRPDANYFGSDVFSFKVNDGTTDSNTAQISLTIEGVNDLPVVQNSSVSVSEDASGEITLSATDIDNDTLRFEIVQEPAHGTLSGTMPTLTYTPAKNYNGSDSFTYIARDAEGSSGEATVSITVNSVNDIPVAEAGDDIVAAEGTEVSLSASGSYDIDGTIASYEWKEGTTLISDSRDFIYTFSSGTHVLTLVVTDDSGATASDSVTVTIEATPQVSFTKMESISPVSQEITALFTEDIDLDGDLDIVYAMGSGSQEIGWYRNNGNLNFTYMSNIVTGVSKSLVAMGDINNDGYPDLIYGKDALYTCTNTHNNNFTCSQDGIYIGKRADDNLSAITIADINNDGRNDVITGRQEPSYKATLDEIVVFLQDEYGLFSSTNVMTIDSDISDVTAITVKDNDNDGDNDLLVSTSSSGVYYYRNDSGTFTKTSLHNVDSTDTFFADIDHDQIYDAVSVQGDARTIQWDTLNSDSVIDPFPDNERIDIDQDGYSDVVPSFSGSQSVVWYQNSADSGNIALTSQTIDTFSSNEVRVVKAVDMDNDGDTDIDIVVGTKSGEIFIYRNNIE